MGDFNVDLISLNGSNACEFFNTLSSYFYAPFILQPTRLRSKTFNNSLEYSATSGNIPRELSDHLIQFLIL